MSETDGQFLDAVALRAVPESEVGKVLDEASGPITCQKCLSHTVIRERTREREKLDSLRGTMLMRCMVG